MPAPMTCLRRACASRGPVVSAHDTALVTTYLVSCQASKAMVNRCKCSREILLQAPECPASWQSSSASRQTSVTSWLGHRRCCGRGGPGSRREAAGRRERIHVGARQNPVLQSSVSGGSSSFLNPPSKRSQSAKQLLKLVYSIIHGLLCDWLHFSFCQVQNRAEPWRCTCVIAIVHHVNHLVSTCARPMSHPCQARLPAVGVRSVAPV